MGSRPWRWWLVPLPPVMASRGGERRSRQRAPAGPPQGQPGTKAAAAGAPGLVLRHRPAQGEAREQHLIPLVTRENQTRFLHQGRGGVELSFLRRKHSSDK